MPNKRESVKMMLEYEAGRAVTLVVLTEEQRAKLLEELGTTPGNVDALLDLDLGDSCYDSNAHASGMCGCPERFMKRPGD